MKINPNPYLLMYLIFALNILKMEKKIFFSFSSKYRIAKDIKIIDVAKKHIPNFRYNSEKQLLTVYPAKKLTPQISNDGKRIFAKKS
jgi:hypothetical protein